MRITKGSASSIKTYYHCSFKYWLEQIIKMESAPGKSALQGTIIHQVLEWMTKLKLKNKTYIPPEWLLEQSWDMHTRLNPGVEIRKITSRGEAADFRKCRESIEIIKNDKEYNIYDFDSKIIGAEIWFEIEMPGEEWECINEEGKKSQFTPRGFIDIVREINQDTIEIIDWKSGKRSDFYSMKEHDFNTLLADIQCRLYHLAAVNLYPQYENILCTFYYTSDGGPITIPLTKQDIVATIDKLWEFFNKAKKDTLLIRNRSWKCRMCPFEKTGICNKVWGELNSMGQKYIEDKYYKMSYARQKNVHQEKDPLLGE